MPAQEQQKQPKAAAPKQPEPDRYKVPKGEEDHVHVIIEKPIFNQFTGERQSKPETVKFSKKDWPIRRQYLPSLGYVLVETLHLPDGCEEGFTGAKPVK